MPRTTKNTIQALERLAEAAGVKLTRSGRNWVVWTPQMDDLDPIPKTSASALAQLVTFCRLRDDWVDLQEAAAYDPGLNLRTGTPDVPESGLAMWEVDQLQFLAVTEREE